MNQSRRPKRIPLKPSGFASLGGGSVGRWMKRNQIHRAGKLVVLETIFPVCRAIKLSECCSCAGFDSPPCKDAQSGCNNIQGFAQVGQRKSRTPSACTKYTCMYILGCLLRSVS
ncbi:MAG: hypothetical protein JRN20_13205 [Nitrososphaerota archaeon]|nr:hypothetical protein [Nitrososphaerota archaeon]